MKKKILCLGLCLLFVTCPLVLIGCNEKPSLQSNISEITKLYFQGSSGEAHGSISVGQREEPYKMDGVHNELYDFSLVVIDFGKIIDEEEIVTSLTINDSEQDFTMYYSPLNNAFMADIGYSLNEDDIVRVMFEDITIDFSLVSDSFQVSWEQALDKATKNIDTKSFYEDGVFKGECYLKVLTERDDNFEDLFWVFTVVGENGEVKNIVISIENGEILANQ